MPSHDRRAAARRRAWGRGPIILRFEPLEERQLRVLGQLEHPLVEGQPGELAVDEERRWQRSDGRRRGRGVSRVPVADRGGAFSRACAARRVS